MYRSTDNSGETSIMIFKDKITQEMLEEFERQYFEVQKVPDLRGVHRNATGNIKSAEAAGWFTESLNGLKPQERLTLSNDIDKMYSSYVTIDPNG